MRKVKVPMFHKICGKYEGQKEAEIGEGVSCVILENDFPDCKKCQDIKGKVK